jgi:hypothetical protein
MAPIIAREVYSSSPFSFNGGAPQPTTQPEENKGFSPQDAIIDDSYEDQEVPESFIDDTRDDEEKTTGTDNQDLDSDESDDGFSNSDSEDVDEEAVVGSLYDAFKQLGFVSDEDALDSKGSISDFLINYEKVKSSKLEEAAKANILAAYPREVLDYVDFLMKGGSPEAVSSFYSMYNMPIDDDFSDVENRKALITSMYKDQGIPDKRVGSLYEKIYDEGEDLEEARVAKEYFKNKHDEQLQAIVQEDKAKEAAAARQSQELSNTLKSMLKSKKIGEIALRDEEARDLESYMFNPSVITDVADPVSGSIYKAKVSQYYVDYQNFFSNPESLIKLANFIKSGGNSNIAEEKVKEKVSMDIFRELNGFRELGNKGKKRRGTNTKNGFLT